VAPVFIYATAQSAISKKLADGPEPAVNLVSRPIEL
jgi:hypothetical protein